MADRVERRLTTILAADVAEYSRLMRVDEDATLAALTDCRAIVDGLMPSIAGGSSIPQATQSSRSSRALPTAFPALSRFNRR